MFYEQSKASPFTDTRYPVKANKKSLLGYVRIRQADDL